MGASILVGRLQSPDSFEFDDSCPLARFERLRSAGSAKNRSFVTFETGDQMFALKHREPQIAMNNSESSSSLHCKNMT